MNQSKIENVQPEQVMNSEQAADNISVSPSIANANVIGIDYHTGPHMDWWNNPQLDHFSLLKKHGYQDDKKPWKYRALTDKGIYQIWHSENLSKPNPVLSAVLPCMVKYKGHGHKLKKIAGEICTIRIAHAAYYLDYDKNVHVSELSLFEPHEHDVDSFNGHCQICGLYCR